MSETLDKLSSRTTAEWIEKDRQYLVHPSPPSTGERLVIVGGEGCTLIDDTGREYLDIHAGAWLVQVGHGRTEIADAIREQLASFAHFSLMLGVTNKPAIALSERLISFAPEGFGMVRYGTSGSEVDDEAIALVRYYHASQGAPDRLKIIALQGAYHGRSEAGHALSKRPIPGVPQPLLDLTIQVAAPREYNNTCPEGEDLIDYCIADLERAIAEHGPENIAAMFGEPAQGPGGMVPLPAEYWRRAEQVLRGHGILFVMDEVVTGIGRTGEWLVSTAIGIKPDMIVLAKGLASGYMPIGALLLSNDFAQAVESLGGAGSYGGHAASCIAALTNIDIIERENLLQNTKERGAQFLRELEELKDLEVVGDVHGAGLMVGVSLVSDRATKEPLAGIDEALTLSIREESGVILHVSRGNVVLTPPLTISEAEVTRTVQALRRGLERIRPDGTLAPVAA